VRDYVRWHDAYSDAGSGLSWRLRLVQRHLAAAFDERSGPVRVVSACAGDGRDVIEVLRSRPDSARISVTLIENHPDIAETARRSAAGLQVEVRIADAGRSDSYDGAVPADVVLLVGIFGNISPADVARTVAAAPALCSPGATLLWSRGVDGDDHNEFVRSSLATAGFVELDYRENGATGQRTALGIVQLRGDPMPLVPGQTFFTFLR
jgi:hypothetical protein